MSCWTCQLRDAVCDGKRPRCRECESCGLVCEGFGARPSWMDGGTIEQAYVEHLKNIADYNLQREARNSTGTSWRFSAGQEHDNASEAGTERSGFDDDEGDGEGNDHDNGNGDDEETPGVDLQTDTGMDDNEMELPAVPDSSSITGIFPYSTPLTTPSVGYNDCEPPSTTASVAPSAAWSSGNASALGVGSVALFDGGQGTNLGHLPPSLLTLPPSALHTQSDAAPACNCFELSCQICSQTLPVLLQFSLQAPFYGEERGWLHLLNLRSELVRCSSLALAHYWSLYLAGIRTDESSFGTLVEAPSYHSMTLSVLQEQIKAMGQGGESVSDTKTLEILVATVNLIFYQALQGISGQWLVHLRAGLNLLQTRMPRKLSLSGLDPNNASAGDPAQTYLVSTFVWLEAFSSALFWDDLVPCDHAVLLARFQAQRADSIAPLGCKSWMVAVVCQANQIRRWKELMTQQGSLSTVLLVSRVSELERYIQSQLRHESTDTGNASDLTTLIYAQAATIYVHVLASGPHPDVPEIRDTVASSLPEIEKAAQLGINWLAWAICVIGSMAATDLRGSLEASVERMDRFYNGASSYGRALAAIRECWRLRDAGSSSVHWASALQSSGELDLLL